MTIIRYVSILMSFVLIALANISGCGGGDSDEVASSIALRVIGEEELVFNWSADRCEELDIPDLPARAFRDDSGQVQLIASHENPVYRFIGPDLDNLNNECVGIMESGRDPYPGSYNDANFIGATYTEDGKTIYAILHHEYHGEHHPGQCPPLGDCWFNSLTLAVSNDSGASYQHPVSPPDHLVATYPMQYIPDIGAYGVFHPSNIVKGKDGYYYLLAGQLEPYMGDGWICLMRTDDLSDPDSWRYWDGTGFEGKFIDPYTEEIDNIEDHLCEPLGNNFSLSSSLTYNTHIDQYIAVGTGGSGENTGFFYSLSKDLINWTDSRLFYKRQLPWSFDIPVPPVYLYPSLIDPDSETRNFETTGKKAYLYYTRLNEGLLDHDLVRVEVEFFME